MRRAHLVAGSTVAGVVAVVGLSVHHPAASLSAGGLSSSSTASPSPSAASGSSPSPSTSPASSASASASTRSATGTDESFRYGDIAVKVTVTGSKITKIGIATISETDGRSAQIDQYAVPHLEQQVLAAGSSQIDGVAGATFTSQAFADSLASALSKLGLA